MVPSEDRVLVMCVGNPLMRDDGAGPRVAEVLLEAFDFPPNVEVMDAGTMGFSILDVFRDIDQLIVVDAVKNTGHDAGTVVVLSPEDMAQSEIIRSAHDTQLIEVLKAAAMLGHVPKTICIGVQIERIEEWVLELSTPVAEAIPVACGAVIGRLRDLGVDVRAKDESELAPAILEIADSHEASAADLATDQAPSNG